MGLPEDAAALLLAQTDLPEPAAEHEAMAIHDCFVAAGASDAMVSTDPVEAEALFDARRLAGPALLWEHEDAVLTEDVCLPRGKLAEMLALIEKIARHAQHPDRHHRARGRRQPAPLPGHPEGRRSTAATARSPPSRRSSTPRSTWAAR